MCLFTAFIGRGQVTLEHTYNGYANIVTFSSNGDKYESSDTLGVYLYNSDHSIWKSITPIPPAGYRLNSAYAISDNLFNTDNSVEFIGVFYSTSFPHYKTYLVTEAGSMTFIDTSYYGTVHFNQSTNSYKLITTILPNVLYSYVSNVYSLPGTIPCGRCGSLGVAKTNNISGQVSATPNPTTGVFRIDAKGQVVITNAAGISVFSTLTYNGEPVDLTKQPTGIYYILYQGGSTPLLKQ